MFQEPIKGNMKKCSKCHKTKDESCYWKNKNRHGKPGLYSQCKICSRNRQKLWRLKNPKKYKAQNKRKEHNRSQDSRDVSKKRQQYHRDVLSDVYVTSLLTMHKQFQIEDITPELIKAIRANIKLKRALGLTNYKGRK